MKETPIKEANNEQVFRDWLMTKSHNQPIRIKYLRVQYNDKKKVKIYIKKNIFINIELPQTLIKKEKHESI